MGSIVAAQKRAAEPSNSSLLAHNLIDKLTVIVGQCELLSEHMRDAEDMARLKSIVQTAKLLADSVNSRQCDMGGILGTRSQGDENRAT